MEKPFEYYQDVVARFITAVEEHNQAPMDLLIKAAYDRAKMEVEGAFNLIDYWYDHGDILDIE